MASNVSVSYTFTNSTTADADEVNSNFSSLVSWINTNAVHLDGSKVFTGAPSYASDPVSNNQLCRKYYVDNKSWDAANIATGAITTVKLSTTAGEIAGAWTNFSDAAVPNCQAQFRGRYLLVGKTLYLHGEFYNAGGGTDTTSSTVLYVDLPASVTAHDARGVQGLTAYNVATLVSARVDPTDPTRIAVFSNTNGSNFSNGTDVTSVRVNGVIEVN